MSAQKDARTDLLKMLAYGLLANFWIDLGTTEAVYEDEAKAFLRLQEALIKEFDATLSGYLDESSIKEFRAYVQKYKVRVAS